jgi:hypothetical protein
VGYRKCLTGLAEVSDTYVTLFIHFIVRRAKGVLLSRLCAFSL